MSAAAPTADAAVAAPAKKGKKKLIVIIAVVLVLLIAGGGGAFFMMKKKAAAAEGEGAEEGGHAPAAHAAAKPDPKHPPTFLPLDPFVVNLADKDADRYAQIGVTLEIEDPKFADQLKTYMPAIRNGVLMILAHKSSKELLERSGKEMLAGQIQREAARTMGFEIEEPDPEDVAAAKDGHDEEEVKPKAKGKKKVKKKVEEPNPIRKVHFSNFIIQ